MKIENARFRDVMSACGHALAPCQNPHCLCSCVDFTSEIDARELPYFHACFNSTENACSECRLSFTVPSMEEAVEGQAAHRREIALHRART
jgi:hypothetical protein